MVGTATVRSSGLGSATPDGSVHLFDRYRFASLALKQPLQLLHRASCGNDGELALLYFHELDAVPGVDPESSADLYGNGDLPL